MFFNSMFVPMLTVYLISFYFVFGFDEWFLVWLGLELNMISFLMMGFKGEDLLMAESMGSYFFVQSLGSGLLLGMMYVGWSDMVWVILLSLSMGAGPFYYWYIKVISGFKWYLNFVLMVFQKVILLMLMSEMVVLTIGVLGVVSMVIGVFGVFNQISMKAILGYSSVFHTGWIMCFMMEGSSGWWMYLFIYGVMIWGVIDLLAKMNLESLNSGSSSIFKKKLLLVVLNLGGIPPMIGFVLSWLTFFVLWEFDLGLLGVMVVLSVGMLYVYFRVMYDVSLGGLNMLGWGISEDKFSWGEIVGFSGLLLVFVVV